MRKKLANYDFRWLREKDHNWHKRKHICGETSMAMMACLLHYDLSISLLVRYLGGEYIAAHRDIDKIVETIRPHVEDYLIPHFVRVMTCGCPNVFNAESTRENSTKYWREGNNPSINKNIEMVMKTACKEVNNKFAIALPMWLWRFIMHLHYVPQHILEVKGKKARQIADAKYRHDATSISTNMMTSTAEGTELECQFGRSFHDLLQRCWNLRISYPDQDIILHSNDVKSCFRQLKHHPDVMGAFSYILGEYLFVQVALSFGADFSPPNWEVVRRVAEQLAEGLYTDSSLVEKHRKHLDRLQWQKSLGSKKAAFTPAKKCSINQGVLDDQGVPVSTPHNFYVDDDLYAEVFDVGRIEQAIASSIEAIFILLGESDLSVRQDPISFDKMEETMIAYLNTILGRHVNTRKMTVNTPVAYIQETLTILRRHWHPRRKTFCIGDIETLAGRLGHISETMPWLRFLMSHVYTSITAALKESEAHLIATNKSFRDMLKLAKNREVGFSPQKDASGTGYNGTKGSNTSDGDKTQALDLEKSFAQSSTAKMIHHNRRAFYVNKSLKKELQLITRALASEWIDMERPISHFVNRIPRGTGWDDASLDAGGGFSIDMRFWWYIEWPEEVRKRTLRYVKNNKDNKLASINVLEYAALIINYVAATHFCLIDKDPSDPYPVVQLFADNTTAEAWAIKACKKSPIGRSLGRIQCALMINNPVGISVGHVSTKKNIIADRISRIKHLTDAIPSFLSLMQDFPQLKSCRRFHPSPELVSLVTDALLQENCIDPLEASRRILADLGKITS